jgi:hypothetical protein
MYGRVSPTVCRVRYYGSGYGARTVGTGAGRRAWSQQNGIAHTVAGDPRRARACCALLRRVDAPRARRMGDWIDPRPGACSVFVRKHYYGMRILRS